MGWLSKEFGIQVSVDSEEWYIFTSEAIHMVCRANKNVLRRGRSDSLLSHQVLNPRR